jgi:hypothetical protein
MGFVSEQGPQGVAKEFAMPFGDYTFRIFADDVIYFQFVSQELGAVDIMYISPSGIQLANADTPLAMSPKGFQLSSPSGAIGATFTLAEGAYLVANDEPQKTVLKSPDGKLFLLKVDNNGELSTAAL